MESDFISIVKDSFHGSFTITFEFVMMFIMEKSEFVRGGISFVADLTTLNDALLPFSHAKLPSIGHGIINNAMTLRF